MKSPSVNFHSADGGISLVSRMLSVIVQPLVLLTILTMAGCAKNLSPGTSREILVKFNPGVQQAQVSALESEVGLQQIKIISELDVRVYRITSSKSVNEAIAICEKKPFVKYAEPNYKYETLKN
jgi:Fervidolysin N-terminal prodomain